jgi:hypothetical protein
MFHHDPQHTGSLAGTNCPEAGCEPAFPNGGFLSEGLTVQFGFTNIGRTNSTWTVYASTNLMNWTNTGVTVSNDPITGIGVFIDPNQQSNVSTVCYYLSNDCCSRVIGFVSFTTNPGANLIADPFDEMDEFAVFASDAPGHPPMNTVGALFSGGNGVPEFPELPSGVNAIGWNGKGYFTNTSTGDRSFVPNGDISLLPGNGAILDMGANDSQSVWFMGLVREAVTNQILGGTNFLGSALPEAGGISTVLRYTNAVAGDWLQKWDPTNGVFITYTNNGGTNWYRSGVPNEPYIGPAEGFILWSATNHTWIQRCSPCEGN